MIIDYITTYNNERINQEEEKVEDADQNDFDRF